MLRQYRAQRFRNQTIRGRTLQVGTVSVGAILLVEGRKVRVEAWLPRDYACRVGKRFVTKRISGGHLAIVRDLRTNKLSTISDAWLRDADEYFCDRRHSLQKHQRTVAA